MKKALLFVAALFMGGVLTANAQEEWTADETTKLITDVDQIEATSIKLPGEQWYEGSILGLIDEDNHPDGADFNFICVNHLDSSDQSITFDLLQNFQNIQFWMRERNAGYYTSDWTRREVGLEVSADKNSWTEVEHWDNLKPNFTKDGNFFKVDVKQTSSFRYIRMHLYKDGPINEAGVDGDNAARKEIFQLGEVQAYKLVNSTGINKVEAAAAENGVAYNLAGQKVANGYKGIVVVNGKKVVK